MASTNLNMLHKTGDNSLSDECYTPPQAILPLLPYLNKDKVYYDCTSRVSSSMVRCFLENGYVMGASGDLNFLTDSLPSFHIDAIITNPPYSIKDRFIERCYELDKPFALLLPVSSIQGKRRGQLFSQYGIQLLVLNDRVDFTGKGAPHFGVAWFCYKLLPTDLIFV